METSSSWDRALDFINSQVQPVRDQGRAPRKRRGGVVTISRQAGAGAHSVAEELLKELAGTARRDEPPWTLFDRDLVERALREHGLPQRLADYMPEDRVPELADTMDQLFGLRPSSWTLVRKTADTVLHVAAMGNVVVIGRAANLITRSFENAIHVRLVAPLAVRVARVGRSEHLDPEQAEASVRTKDRARRRYVQKYYRGDIDDPLAYDLVINTDRLSYVETAQLIAEAVTARGLLVGAVHPTDGHVA